MRKLLVAALLAFVTLSAAADTIVIAVRHAEKVPDGSKDPLLTEEGQKRAELLARMLRDAGVSAIYSTSYHRTRNTAAPLAKALGIAVTEDDANPAALAERILKENRGKTVLVVGHSNTIPPFLKALGVVGAPAIGDSEHDNLFIAVVPDEGKARLLRLRY